MILDCNYGDQIHILWLCHSCPGLMGLPWLFWSYGYHIWDYGSGWGIQLQTHQDVFLNFLSAIPTSLWLHDLLTLKTKEGLPNYHTSVTLSHLCPRPAPIMLRLFLVQALTGFHWSWCCLTPVMPAVCQLVHVVSVTLLLSLVLVLVHLQTSETLQIISLGGTEQLCKL